MHHLHARVRLGGIELEIRESAPGLAAAVVLRLVLSDESRLEHERFEFASGRHVALDPSHLAEKVLDLLSLVAVEVGLHARPEISRLPDVEDALVPTHEAVDAGGVGERVGEPDLAVVRPPTSANGFAEIAERQDAEPAAEVEEPVQDLRARHRIVQRPMGRLHPGPEILGERQESDVGDVGPHDPTSQLGGADRRTFQDGVVEPTEVLVQEREIEPRVVSHEDGTARELQEGR